jgi:hypothetical protein
MLDSKINLDNPKKLSTNNIKNITTNPLDAPLISAVLKDMWEDIHIAINKNI